MTIEKTILSSLLFNEEYGRRAIPFIKDEYFKDVNDRVIFNLIDEYLKKYNAFPSKEALIIDLSNYKDLNEHQFKDSTNIIENLSSDPSTKITWLLDQTEKFCQDQALGGSVYCFACQLPAITRENLKLLARVCFAHQHADVC